MPYIKKQNRALFDPDLRELGMTIETVGDLNYCMTVLAHRFLHLGGEISYARLNAIMGVFDCAAKEFYRTVVVPYEEKKIRENGDIAIGG